MNYVGKVLHIATTPEERPKYNYTYCEAGT